jgi:hypothetical protein
MLDGQRDCKIIQTRPFEHLTRLGGPKPCKILFRHFGKQVCFDTHPISGSTLRKVALAIAVAALSRGGARAQYS